MCNLIGREEYNIGRISLNIELLGKIKTKTFYFRERMQIYYSKMN